MKDNPTVAPITASYVMDFGHFDAMCRASEDRFSRWLSRWAFWPLVAVNAATGLWLMALRLGDGLPLGLIHWLGIAVALALLAGRYLIVPALRRYNLKSTRLGGRDYHVTLGHDDIRLEAGDISSKVGLKEIMFATETRGHVILWINKRQGVIVPKDEIDPPHGLDDVRAYIGKNDWELRTQ